MIIRVAASFLVVLGIGAILLAHDTAARPGGGLAGGRPAPVAHATHPAGMRPFIHPGRATVGSRAVVRSHALRTPFARHRRLGFGWPAAWSGEPWYDPYYDPTGRGAPRELPPSIYPTVHYPAASSAPVTQRVIYVIPYRPGCDSQTQKLPWRDGGERSVTIVRC
jgi:hypothetical protein